MTIIYAILIFCLLITVHELGHFVVAKACGVKVNEFAIGMGPAFFQKQKGETLYSLRVFPIGGFCAMEGEDEDSKDERAFNNKPAWQRALVLAAGSFMNLVPIPCSAYAHRSTASAACRRRPEFHAGPRIPHAAVPAFPTDG